jgi:hypothetical protein
MAIKFHTCGIKSRYIFMVAEKYHRGRGSRFELWGIVGTPYLIIQA